MPTTTDSFEPDVTFGLLKTLADDPQSWVVQMMLQLAAVGFSTVTTAETDTHWLVVGYLDDAEEFELELEDLGPQSERELVPAVPHQIELGPDEISRVLRGAGLAPDGMTTPMGQRPERPDPGVTKNREQRRAAQRRGDG